MKDTILCRGFTSMTDAKIGLALEGDFSAIALSMGDPTPGWKFVML